MLSIPNAPARLIAQRLAQHSASPSFRAAKPSLNARIAALPWNRNEGRWKTMLGLSEAATAAGVAKSTIWRAVKSGRISATKTHTGTYEVDPAELFRVFPAMPRNGAMKQAATPIAPAATTGLDAQISALKEVSSLLKEQLEDIRKDRDAWRTQAESSQRLLVDGRPRRRGLFGWHPRP
jgi:hypothetical protein